MDELWRALQAGLTAALNWLNSIALNLLAVVVVLIFTLLLARRMRGFLVRKLSSPKADLNVVFLLDRLFYIGILAAGFLIMLSLFSGLSPLVATILGVLGVATGLALQDVFRNLVAGIYLLLERPYRIGDTIRVREMVGVVEQVNVRTTTLRNLEGYLVIVPNFVLFSDVVVNRSLKQPGASPRRRRRLVRRVAALGPELPESTAPNQGTEAAEKPKRRRIRFPLPWEGWED